nr:glycosyltransferase [uncultured Desulfobacter sp.]
MDNSTLNVGEKRWMKDLLVRYFSEKEVAWIKKRYQRLIIWKIKGHQLWISFLRVLQGLTIKIALKVIENFHSDTDTSSRKKPHFSILMWKFLSGHGQYLSTEHNNVVNSLSESDYATFDVYFYDTNYSTDSIPTRDLKFISHIKKTAPDALILSSYDHRNIRQPNRYTIKYISEKMGIPIISIWWDSVNIYFYKRSFLPIADIIDLNIFIDSGKTCKNSRYADRCLHLWAPEDPQLFYNPNAERIYDVCFLGSTSSYRSIRKKYLERIKNLGTDYRIILSGGTGSQRLSELEYAAVMQKSKISVNFSHSVQDAHQLKGRVLETMLCGALLLESENDEIKRLFIPYEDYVPFKSTEDMIQKIQFYLKNESELNRIANNGYQKANRLYSNKKFWEKVIFQLKTISKKEDLIS